MSEISVTVVYALPDAAIQVALRLPRGATVADAIERSGIEGASGAAGAAGAPVGIFGKRARRDSVLADGDRVEIYRPLKADPKRRRLRPPADKQR